MVSFDDEGRPAHFNGVTTDVTELKKYQERQVLLAREVDHRAKNALAVVQSIVRLARRDTAADYARAIEGRIEALAQTHELLSQARWRGADIRALIHKELSPYDRGEAPACVSMIGPAVMLAPETAQAVALAIHELATNAAKYGSLSRENGRVDVSWDYRNGMLSLSWSESGGPPVTPPKVVGFGTTGPSNSLGGSEGSEVKFDWRPDGLRFTMMIHCRAAAEEEAAPLSPRPPPERDEEPAFPPCPRRTAKTSAFCWSRTNCWSASSCRRC